MLKHGTNSHSLSRTRSLQSFSLLQISLRISPDHTVLTDESLDAVRHQITLDCVTFGERPVSYYQSYRMLDVLRPSTILPLDAKRQRQYIRCPSVVKAGGQLTHLCTRVDQLEPQLRSVFTPYRYSRVYTCRTYSVLIHLIVYGSGYLATDHLHSFTAMRQDRSFDYCTRSAFQRFVNTSLSENRFKVQWEVFAVRCHLVVPFVAVERHALRYNKNSITRL